MTHTSHSVEVLGRRARSYSCKHFGTEGAAPHWMLWLRYCRNMLASCAKFSSLGCILV